MTLLKYWLPLLCCLPAVFLSAQCDLVVEAGPDVTICGLGNTATLSGSVAGNFTNFQWTPAAGLSNPNGLSPTVSAPGVYTLTATGPSNINLIANGDFEAGAGGFSSDYTFSPIPILNGTYTTVTSPQLVVSTFPPCDDHTFGNGTGQMLLVNGDGTPGENVWCQTVPVMPNTNYSLSAWVSTLVPIGLAQLQFSVNGQLLGGPVSPTSTPCEWVPFAATWNSGASTSATVCIVTQSTAGFGNDFVLDDIEMYGECQVSDQVVVTQLPEPEVNVQAVRCLGDCYFIGNTPYCSGGNYSQTLLGANGCDSTVNLQLTVLEAVAFVLPPDTLSCYNDFTVTLDASFSTLSPFTTYNWSGPNGFSSNLQNPVVSAPGTYTLEVVTSDAGTTCTGTTSVAVLVQNNQPIVDAGPDLTLGCGLSSATLNGSIDNLNSQVVYAWSGPNGFSSSGLSPEVEAAGVYVLEATDELSGCSSQDSMRLTLGGAALSATLEADTLTCAQPLANLAALPDSNAIQVQWSGPNGFQDTLANTQVDAPGWYTFWQIDSAGCTGVDSVLVEADTLLPAFGLSTAALSCNQPTGSLMATGLSSYDTLWWSGTGTFSGGGEVVQVDTPGLYLLQVIGENGCARLDSVVVSGDFVPPALITTGATLDCGETTVLISASSTDTIPDWSWSGPNGFTASGDTIAVSTTGSYTVTATGENGCAATATAQVQAGQGLPQITASGGTLNCLQTEVILDGAATSSASLQWSGPDGFVSNAATPAVSTPGDYTLTATLGLNCSVDTTVSVLLDTLSPILTLQADTIDCLQTGATLSGSSSLPATYNWFGPDGYSSDMPTAMTAAPGWYTLSATADNGCSAQDSVLVIEDTAPPVVDVQGGTLSCNVTTVSLQANPLAGALYQWSGPGGFTSGEQQPTVSEAGLYTLTLTGLNGCSSADTAVVSADTIAPEVQLSADTLTCAQQQLPINILGNTPGLSYNWFGPNGFSSTLSSPVVDQPGLYELQVEAGNGCRDTATVAVNQDTLSPSLQLNADTISCLSAESTLSAIASAEAAVVWSGPGGFSAATPDTTTTVAGWYTALATSDNGCSTQDSILVIQDQAPPSVSAQGGGIDCAMASFMLQSTASAGVTYQWSGPSGYTADEAQPNVSQAGVYTLTVTAPNGCTATDTAVVQADTLSPQLELTADTLSCAQTQVQIVSVANLPDLNYSWSGPDGFAASMPDPTVDQAGLYTLEAQAPNGCQTVATIQVGIDTLPPSLQPSADTLNCAVQESRLVSGATGFVEILWLGPNGFNSTLDQPLVDTPGSYQLTVTAANGCSRTDSVRVVEDVSLPQLQASGDTLSCAETEVVLAGSSEDTNDVLVWYGPGGFSQDGDTVVVAEGGTYKLVATAANACQDSLQLSVPVDTVAPQLSLSPLRLDCEQTAAPLPVVLLSPAPVSVFWEGPAGFTADSLQPIVQEAGAYTLLATGANGCQQSGQVLVTLDTLAPSISLAASNMLNCSIPETVLQAAGVEAGYDLQWSLGQSTLPTPGDTVQVNAAGSYQLIALDPSNGCADTASLAVTIDTLPPQASAEVLGNLDCQTDTVTLVGSGSGAGGSLSFEWSTTDGAFGESPGQATTTAIAPGNYLLTVESSENGCQATDTVNVWENAAYPESIALSIFPPQCIGGTGRFQVLSIEGGKAPYLYALEGGAFTAVDSFAQLQPGVYTLTVEDANGCQISQSVSMPAPLPLTVNLPMEIELGFSDTYQINPALNFPESIIASINWSPSDYLSCADCLRPVIEQAREDVAYTLSIETDQGCTVSAQLRLKVVQERSVYVPNAFSPGNADGRNDYFTVYASANEVARVKRLTIFDRWGGQVFERQDFPPNEPSRGWDGRYRGEKAPAGTYAYWAEIEFVDGETLLQKGELMLLR